MASPRSLLRLLRKKLQYQSHSVTPLPSVLKYSEGVDSAGITSIRYLALLGAGVSGVLSLGTVAYADEAEYGLSYPSYPWPHKGVLSSYVNAPIQRGQQVFQHDCASCHTSLISYRDLGSIYTEEETRTIAAEIEVNNSPSDNGKAFTCPRKLSDCFSQSYAIEHGARFSNGGAYNPDLSLITKACRNGQNIFSLLTGCQNSPAGVVIREGLHHNPYLSSGAIAMPKIPNVGAMEYEDGTPPTKAWMGKDVVTFLSWAA